MRLGRRVMAAGAALTLLAGVMGSASAQFALDTKIGEANLGNSSEAQELGALAGFLGVDVSELSLLDKNEAPAAQQNLPNLDQWFIDVTPDTPGWFILKFGIGGLSGVTADTFFFTNIADLTKLVFSNEQVQFITGGCESGPCNIERLSHYTTVVPLPAAAWLLLTALAGLFGWRRWAGRSEPATT